MANDPVPGSAEPRVWLVDGFNVLCAAVLGGRDRAGWWSEARRAELLRRAAAFDDASAEIWVVFDGPCAQGNAGADASGAPRVREVFAPCADEWLVARVGEAAQPARLAVVSDDRKVAARARRRGASIVSPREFLARCPETS